MSKEKLILSLIVLTGLLGLALFGNGISGLVVYENNLKSMEEICSPDPNDNSTCNVCSTIIEDNVTCENTDQVCCPFYGEKSGICHDSKMCGIIFEITKNEKAGNVPSLMSPSEPIQKLNSAYLLQAILGALIVVLLTLAAYYYVTHHKVEIRKRKVHSN